MGRNGKYKIDDIDKLLSIFLKVAAIVSVVWGGVVFLNGFLLSWSDELDRPFSGCYTNFAEGCLGCEYDGEPPIYIDMYMNKGELIGSLDVSERIIKKKNNNDLVQELLRIRSLSLIIEGIRRGKSIQIDIFEYKDGKKNILGKAKLQDKGDYLSWHLSEGDPNLPLDTKLYSYGIDCNITKSK